MVKTTNKAERKFKFIVISLLASFLFVVSGFYYLNKIVTNINNSKIKIEESKRDIALLDKIISDQKQYKTDIQKVKSTLPSQYYEISFFTSQIERIAQNNNLAMTIIIDSKKKVEKENYDSLVYSLDLNGSYSSVSEFLSQISKLPFHTSIDNLKMAMDAGNLKTKIKFRIFVEK